MVDSSVGCDLARGIGEIRLVLIVPLLPIDAATRTKRARRPRFACRYDGDSFFSLATARLSPRGRYDEHSRQCMRICRVDEGAAGEAYKVIAIMQATIANVRR